jgi:hypothetical protein
LALVLRERGHRLCAMLCDALLKRWHR